MIDLVFYYLKQTHNLSVFASNMYKHRRQTLNLCTIAAYVFQLACTTDRVCLLIAFFIIELPGKSPKEWNYYLECTGLGTVQEKRV